MNTHDQSHSTCSFCRNKINNHKAVQGQDAFICYDCITQSKSLLDQSIQQEQKEIELAKIKAQLLYPQQIFDRLNEYVIGQTNTKKILSVAVYNHYKRINYLLENHKQDFDGVEIDKSNILLIGPSGTGKTLLASTLAKTLGVPFAIADATTLTEAGYVGDDVENILLRLIQNADYNISWAEKGIVFIDEVDKVGRKSENTSITRDVSGEGVQQALLKIIEGTIATVPPQAGRKHPQSKNLSIDTKNILFICGGAFVGIDELIKKRTNLNTIGFANQPTHSKKSNDGQKNLNHLNVDLDEVTPDDLTHFGLIPELVGRLPIISKLKALTDEELRKILTIPKNSIIKQYQKLLSLDNKNLIVDQSGLDYIIEQAKKYNTGARSLRGIMEKLMLPINFSGPIATDKRPKNIVISKHGIK